MTVDDLATQGASVLTSMVLVYYWNISDRKFTSFKSLTGNVYACVFSYLQTAAPSVEKMANACSWNKEDEIQFSIWLKDWVQSSLFVARSRKSLATLTLGSSKIKLLTISRLWRYCGPSNYRFNFILYWYAPRVFFWGRQCAFVFPIYVRKYRK